MACAPTRDVYPCNQVNMFVTGGFLLQLASIDSLKHSLMTHWEFITDVNGSHL